MHRHGFSLGHMHVFICLRHGTSKQVTATIPSFSVTLNELSFDDNDYAKCPLLVYQGITYFPLTYQLSNMMNLDTSWTEEGGLVVNKGNPETPKEFSYGTPTSQKNSKRQTATIVSSKVTLNGKVIDNKNEPYPLLLFRNITYFPLTWRFAVEEFGWNYIFDSESGLKIRANSYFYNTKLGVWKYYDPILYVRYSETHYIKGDLRIYMHTMSTSPLGDVKDNLLITKGGKENRPNGFFGHNHESNLLFTIDGDYIITTYYAITHNVNPQPCKVNIETGEVIVTSD